MSTNNTCIAMEWIYIVFQNRQYDQMIMLKRPLAIDLASHFLTKLVNEQINHSRLGRSGHFL